MSDEVPPVELGPLGFDGGANVLLDIALAGLRRGATVGVRGSHPELSDHLAAWCRQQGHRWHAAPSGSGEGVVGRVERGPSAGARWLGAERAGRSAPGEDGGPVASPPARWGLAARGAAVEPGGPEPEFRLDRRDELWTDRAPTMYAQAVAGQWNPDVAIDWNLRVDNREPVEAAVVQVMTFLIENEEAALVIPARFLGQVHPHFREIQQMLAMTVVDEARHIEVFTRRATISGRQLALSTVGGRTSLQTLIDEPDYATAAFLLSVMGEGTFVSLLTFLADHAPDPLTRRIAQLSRTDEARHVAFAIAHLERHVGEDPQLRNRLARAVERRHHALRATAGLNEEVFDALVLLAAGDTTPSRIAAGWHAVQALQDDMAEGRRSRLNRLGFTTVEAETLASLHTRNFM